MKRLIQSGPRATYTVPAAGGAMPGGWIDVKKKGAAGDAIRLIGSVAAGSRQFTLASGSPNTLSRAHEGRLIAVIGAGANGASLKTTIASVESATECTLGDAAVTGITASGSVNAVAGTDDAAAIQAAVDSLVAARGGVLYFPPGVYLLWNQGILLPAGSPGVQFIGASNTASSVVYAGQDAAISIGSVGAFIYRSILSSFEVDIACAGPNAVGILTHPALSFRYADLHVITATRPSSSPSSMKGRLPSVRSTCNNTSTRLGARIAQSKR